MKVDLRSPDPQDDSHWPQSCTTTGVPTPYEIFRQQRGAPYSKRRFYELVKIYHPDRSCHQGSIPGCDSQIVRLERYRLIIAANEILSDPVKRGAYDRLGLGWIGRSEAGHDKHDWGHTYGRGWSAFDHNSSPVRNATWEDWERWYERRDAKGTEEKQAPLYFSNGEFIMVLIIIGVIGGMSEFVRAGHMSKTFLQQVEARHDETSKELQRRKKETQGTNDRNERIQKFLRVKDPIASGLADPQEDTYRRRFLDRNVCMSNDVKTRASGDQA